MLLPYNTMSSRISGMVRRLSPKDRLLSWGAENSEEVTSRDMEVGMCIKEETIRKGLVHRTGFVTDLRARCHALEKRQKARRISCKAEK